MGSETAKRLLLETISDDGATTRLAIDLPIHEIRSVSSNLTAGKVWPASIVLSHFLLHHKGFLAGRKVFEFGSGIAVPSLAAYKGGIAAGVFLQELDIDSLLAMQRLVFAANGLATEAPAFNQVPLKWGAMPQDFVEAHPGEVGLFIAADCLYEKNDFADLVATVAFFLDRYRGVPFVMCYQDRNLLYSIDELFEFWGLKSELIEFEDFRFDPEGFARSNDPSIVDDFPLENARDVLVMLEICRNEDSFVFAKSASECNRRDE